MTLVTPIDDLRHVQVVTFGRLQARKRRLDFNA